LDSVSVVVFVSVVPATQWRPVAGVGSASVVVFSEVVDLAVGGGGVAAGPDAGGVGDGDGVAGRSGEESGLTEVDGDGFGVDDDSSEP
jgi:hypothetical protein